MAWELNSTLPVLVSRSFPWGLHDILSWRVTGSPSFAVKRCPPVGHPTGWFRSPAHIQDKQTQQKELKCHTKTKGTKQTKFVAVFSWSGCQLIAIRKCRAAVTARHIECEDKRFFQYSSLRLFKVLIYHYLLVGVNELHHSLMKTPWGLKKNVISVANVFVYFFTYTMSCVFFLRFSNQHITVPFRGLECEFCANTRRSQTS